VDRRLAARFSGLWAFSAVLLTGACQPQLISPYNADLQKRATDMLADVSAWDQQMYGAAGTAASDPRSAAVQAKLAGWSGTIEGMAAIEAGSNPNSASCDAFVGRIAGGVTKALAGLGGSAQSVTAKCESLPDILQRMATQVNEKLPEELSQQCVPMDASGATPVPIAQPTAAQYQAIKTNCQALFAKEPSPSGRALHGDAVSSLVVDLDAIIYRESRQAPKTGS
jgi:hypothetical protein